MHLNIPEGKIISLTLSFIIAFLNISEIVLIIRCKNRKAFDKLLISLAVSDILVAFSVASFKLVDLITSNTVPWLEGQNYASILLLSITFSLANLIAITADRFLAVRFPIKHRILSTGRRVNVVIVTIWSLCIVSVTILSVIQFRWEDQIRFTLNIASGFLLLFGVVMIMVYINIFYVICKRREPSKTGLGEQNKVTTRRPALHPKGPNMTERGVFITGAIVTITFIICTYPFAISFLIKQSNVRITLSSKLLILLNSLFNPLIYFFKSYFCSRPNRRDGILK